MVSRSTSFAALRQQHSLAPGALLDGVGRLLQQHCTRCITQYYWLLFWQQHGLARGASLDIVVSVLAIAAPLGTWCLARYYLAWHVMSHSISLAALAIAALLSIWCLARRHWLRLQWQHCLARDASFDIVGCAYSGSTAWHLMPQSISLAALAIETPLGIWCLARYGPPHLRQQHCFAFGASLKSVGVAFGSIAWHLVPRSPSLVALTAAALLGT